MQNLRNAFSATMASTLSGHNQHIHSCDATGARTQMLSVVGRMVQAFRIVIIIASHEVVLTRRGGSQDQYSVHTVALSCLAPTTMGNDNNCCRALPQLHPSRQRCGENTDRIPGEYACQRELSCAMMSIRHSPHVR